MTAPSGRGSVTSESLSNEQSLSNNASSSNDQSSSNGGLLPSRDHRERSPSDVEEYLKDQEYVFDQIKAEYPMPSDMIERFERAKKEAAPRPA
jgi:hypothetical protein